MKQSENVKKIIQKIKKSIRSARDLYEVRDYYSHRFLRGSGVEIGALHCPLPVDENVKVKYVDCASKSTSEQKFPELDSQKIVAPDFIEDGFELPSFPDGSLDFIIANHILEHSENPLQVLYNWSLKLKENGLLFVTVPILETCFDCGRKLTTLEHLINDYLLSKENKRAEMGIRNRDHFEEWVRISIPAIYHQNGQTCPFVTETEKEDLIDQMMRKREEIHFHTFSPTTFNEIAQYVVNEINRSLLLELVEDSGEILSLFRKV
jgi:SAM-dependent methyltransferase